MRAFLRTARPLLDQDWSEPLRDEIKWIGTALGSVRDLDVLLEHLRGVAAGLEPADQRALRRLFGHLEEEHAEARATLLDALRSERYLALLDRIEEAARLPRVAQEGASLGDLAAKEFRKLRKAVGALGDEPADDELHQLRIKGKRARYAAELAEVAVGKRASRFIAEAKNFQDVLGEHQDGAVAEERIRGALKGLGGTGIAFAAGRLVEHERARRLAARSAFPDAWKSLKRRGREAWT
jgi:CHAD domain-containing protein